MYQEGDKIQVSREDLKVIELHKGSLSNGDVCDLMKRDTETDKATMARYQIRIDKLNDHLCDCTVIKRLK